MKGFIINTESFSAKGAKDTKIIDKSFLPRHLSLFLQKFGYPYIILDESSKIKTTSAMAEHKKSSRCRVIKTLNDVGEKSILTGTLKSKSPLNVYDQFKFLSESFFPETMFEFAERYCVMITIRVGRGRRVCISEKDWNKIRTRMVNAYARGGQLQLDMSRASLFKEYTIDEFNLNWIMSHQVYTPFTRQAELFKRIEEYTMVVKREDVFDISFEKFVHEPIIRYVEISEKAKKIGNELIKLGFTDNIVLGQAPALELTHRLQDLCNGFEPIATVLPDGSREISYKALDENPKLEEIFELLEEIGVENHQVAVISSRINMLEAIEERLLKDGISFTHYEKATKGQSEEDFVAGRAQVFLSSLAPSAYGLNCLAKCDYIIYACVDNSTETFYQSKHRILRGQLDHAKFAYMICVRNSIEERIARSLQRGIELISYRNDKKTFEFK